MYQKLAICDQCCFDNSICMPKLYKWKNNLYMKRICLLTNANKDEIDHTVFNGHLNVDNIGQVELSNPIYSDLSFFFVLVLSHVRAHQLNQSLFSNGFNDLLTRTLTELFQYKFGMGMNRTVIPNFH